MIKIFKILTIFLLIIICWLWLLTGASGHNISNETHITFAVLILFLGFVLFLLIKSKR